jgi:predicted PurR-regulated permease PerM
MDRLKTTNRLLLFLAIVLFFYLLKTLSFIFIPLVFSLFISVLFLPLMRWFSKKKTPKIISVATVVLIMLAFLVLIIQLLKLSIIEISKTENLIFNLQTKLAKIILSFEQFLGVNYQENATTFYLKKIDWSIVISNVLLSLKNNFTLILMTLFFVILWSIKTINFQKILQVFLGQNSHNSIKTFRTIEKDMYTFLQVKSIVSLFTGIAFTIACYSFGVSLPIFWGIFAFSINFVQMIGSVVSVVLLSLFALLEIHQPGILLFFIIIITGIQAFFGGLLEPLLMGKSFSINILTIVVMLMFWAYIWGIAGIILAIPLTVFFKIILREYKSINKYIVVIFNN